MRGSIRKRGNTYSVVLYLGVGPDGKKHYKWLVGGRTKREAERRLAEALYQVDTNTLAEPKGTVADFLERWLREYAWTSLSPRTAEGYQAIVRGHVMPALGRIPLKSLKPEHLQRFYAAELERGLSTTTVRHDHMLIHRALKHAVQWGLLARNPADAVSAPPMRHTPMRTLTEAHVERVLDALTGSEYFTLFYLAIFTGMRRSELLALQWGSVDLIGAEISVNRSIHRLRNGAWVSRAPKTDRSRRTIALSPSTCQVLREHWDHQAELSTRLGAPEKDGALVFCQSDGSPLLPHTVSQAWRRTVRRLGLAGIRFHDLRHTHASLLLKQGVHPKIVQERLGHSSISITLDTYSHVAPGLQEAAAAGFDAILGQGISRRLAEPAGDGRVA